MLSIFQWFGYQELSPAESFRLIKQAGFDAVLLWWDDEFDPDYRKQPELAQRAGLYVENIHAPFGDTKHSIWVEGEAGQAIFERYMQCIDDCATFEIPTVVMHISRNSAPPLLSELGLERLKRIADSAEKHNINIAIENLCSIEAMIRVTHVLDQIDSPHLGLCFDSGHLNAQQTPKLDWLARFGHRLMALHLHDNHSINDEHLLPFDGTIDWSALMKQIVQTGYAGPTTLEVDKIAEPGTAPEDFLAQAYERAKRLKELRS